jgi:hypothetical protein
MKRSALKQAEDFKKLSGNTEQKKNNSENNKNPFGNISSLLNGLTSSLFENDSLIIIILILLMIKEGSDKEIILALVYILL